MLAVNCRAYQAALILFDAIKRVANRDCTSVSLSSGMIPSHTTVPFYDHLEPGTSTSTTSQLYADVGNQNTEEKLKNVMNAWFSKDSLPLSTAPTTSSVGTAPVITPLHTHVSVSGQAPVTFAKRSNDVDWLYQYSQPPPTNYSVSQPQFDASCRSTLQFFKI